MSNTALKEFATPALKELAISVARNLLRKLSASTDPIQLEKARDLRERMQKAGMLDDCKDPCAPVVSTLN